MSISKFAVAAIALLALLQASTVFGQGVYVSGVGPVNRSMGGAGTAAPLDAIGALHWNPASISGMENEVGFGAELLAAEVELNSNVGPGTTSDSGAVAIPSVGWVHHLDDSPLTIGLGLAGVGGFRNIQPSGNAILGGTPAYAAASFLQITPTASYAVNEKFSLGLAPTVTIGEIGFDPVGPSVITSDPTPGQGNRSHFGLGFQVGAFYIHNEDIRFGLMYRSPQWTEDYEFFVPRTASNPDGLVKFKMDLPQIVSLGTAYTGIESYTIAADVRYFGFGEADGFSTLGWSSVFAGALGIQKQMNERLALRVGANFNAPPIHNDDAATNIVSPLIQSYNLACGGSYNLTEAVSLNGSYVYLGKTSLTGPVGPFTITNEIEAHSLLAGVTVRY
jgi:long-chain fatty acid transport protein